jgi:hypothetical protein
MGPRDGGSMTHTKTEEISSPEVPPSIRLDDKHPLAIRWMHWINFPVLFTMVWSLLMAKSPVPKNGIPLLGAPWSFVGGNERRRDRWALSVHLPQFS